jgi:hypothetical protein
MNGVGEKRNISTGTISFHDVVMEHRSVELNASGVRWWRARERRCLRIETDDRRLRKELQGEERERGVMLNKRPRHVVGCARLLLSCLLAFPFYENLFQNAKNNI